MVSTTDSDEDRKERDEFAERLKKKDKERTRNIAIPRSGKFKFVREIRNWSAELQQKCVCVCRLDKKAYEEAAKRLKLENAREKETIIPRLRIESRRKYLEKRKDYKVVELEANILDDEYLFDAEE